MSTYTQTQARAPPAQLKRTSSFFGAIKDIVTAPLSWFGSGEEDFGETDAKGKRRRLPTPSEQTRGEEDSEQQRTKRMRVGSPPNRDKKPYLDPPRSAFNQTHKTIPGARVQNQRHPSPSPRKALRVPTATPRNRRTMSPYPSGSQSKAQPVVRTMSLDPPSGLAYSGTPARLQPAPTMQDVTEEGDIMSISREPSILHLRMRTSVTPQPSGSDFGPVVPPRRERDPTEPPPLTALMSNPMFVKPPPGLQKSGATEVTRQATLGSLLDSQRGVSTILSFEKCTFDTNFPADPCSTGISQIWPINAAEKTLHELEVYKTPLLPSRLKGAPVPDMFIPKKSRPITLMHDRDRERKKGKGKSKMKDRDGVNGTKPYAGEGGMKKWLARRQREEEAVRVREETDKEKEKEQAMDEDEDAEAEAEMLREQQKKEQEGEAKRKKELEADRLMKAPAFEPRFGATREMSSLRVGRSRMRNHIERPTSRRTNKFSAAFEDDEDAMDDDRTALEEAAKKAPVFEIPAGFTFAKETPIPQDVANAKEPPISALPFSLSKPTALASAAKPVSVSEPPAPVAPAIPTISLAPPTPQPPKSEAHSLVPTLPPLTVTPGSGSPTPPLAPAAQVPEALKISKASPLFATPAPSAAPAITSAFGTTPVSTSTSIFGTSATTISFKVPALVEETPTPSFAPPAAPAPLPAASSLPFSFGASAPAPEVDESPSLFGVAPSAAPFNFGTSVPSKTAFSFGQPAPAPSIFSFGAPAPSTSPVPAPAAGSTAPAEEKSKKSFTFGSPPPAPPAAPASSLTPAHQEISMDESPSQRPTLDFSFNTASSTPSPATTTGPGFGFGTAKDKDKLGTFGSGFGQSSGTGFGFGQKAPEPSAPASAAPFSFAQAASPSVAPTASNPFGQQSTSAPSAPSFGFGGSQPASPAAPAGGSFAFGQPTPNPFAPAAAPASGNTLFTIGAAPQPDGRQIKKLPRRGMGRR
ncbi:hypothetical protein K503DRAFT_846974 [Rhizopogon vinicolor AM-OR11-026]|uniref:Uncharacterized protein n=1 Tax=Rhizopogon vinicolor AM-OR11-026 TaxID=1314800 RepID=A0A1B7NGG0_9AGAM|nr:hypothetical protein K503DRAFT_846974 [Rhizopogon vinicolor AM-OR11-026]